MKTKLPDGYFIHQISLRNGFTYRLGTASIHSIQLEDEEGYICYGRDGMLVLVEESEVCSVEIRTTVREGVPATQSPTEINNNLRHTRRNRRKSTQDQEQLELDLDDRGNR